MQCSLFGGTLSEMQKWGLAVIRFEKQDSYTATFPQIQKTSCPGFCKSHAGAVWTAVSTRRKRESQVVIASKLSVLTNAVKSGPPEKSKPYQGSRWCTNTGTHCPRRERVAIYTQHAAKGHRGSSPAESGGCLPPNVTEDDKADGDAAHSSACRYTE